MKQLRQHMLAVATIIIVVFTVFIFALDQRNIPNSLAYPPAEETTGYPGPATETPSPTATESGYASGPTPTFTPTPSITPWPTPTPNPLATHPPNTFRQGVVSRNHGWTVDDRHNLGSWGWTYSYNGPYPTNVYHVPFLIQRINPSELPTESLITYIDNNTPHDYWLVFNECEHNNQCDESPEVAADFYYEEVLPLMDAADPNHKLIVGGVNANPCGILWLTQFVTYYRENYGNLNNAGWHFHLYPEVAPGDWPDPNHPERACNTWDNEPISGWVWRPERLNFETWKSDAANILGFMWNYGDPNQDEVWITEMGCLYDNSKGCPAEGFMDSYTADITGWLNSDEGRWVDKYSWYADLAAQWYTALYDEPSTPGNYRPLGAYYSQISQQVAASIPIPTPSAFVYLPAFYRFPGE